MVLKDKPKKVLLLGSGALQIGQAGEFDYSGSQAIKALKEEGIQVIVINPNIATVQTSKGFADEVYFLPVTPYFVEKVIEREKPDAILLSFGGQTGLNCGVELENTGVLKKYNVKVLGTPVRTIELTEDRELFNKELGKIDVKVPKSFAVSSTKDALKAAEKIGYHVMVRAAFALGGKGSGVVKNKKLLEEMVDKAFKSTKQILVEECLSGWKEIEYEVVRDCNDNCITVCNMENFDPLGIHTGESIVVAPSQTIDNHEYHMLREISIRVIRHLGVVGECNIQFALNPENDEYRVIEVNARLSRSSALASKATGYPLAFVAAKLGLGYTLLDLDNLITKKTKACFEPALDYVVVKIPRWDLKKFRNVSRRIGTEMKSVGEVMAIGKTFEEAMQKAIRMLHIGMYGLVGNKLYFKKLAHSVKYPTDKRVFAVVEALEKNIPVGKIHGVSKIDKWFLYKIKNVVETKKEIEKYSLANIPKELLLKAKKQGYSDKQIAMLLKDSDGDESNVRAKRKEFSIVPFVKQIDTLAAEYPAKTNYLYLTYNGIENDVAFGGNSVIVLGSGAYRIGSSVEFDFCCVSAARTSKQLGFETIMINFNPETVSTDYNECDKLYFDELSFETVQEIYEKENAKGLIVSMGGQIPNNLALKCHEHGLRVLGTNPIDIDKAEDRNKFSMLCDSLGIPQPEWRELKDIESAKKFAKDAGFPVLVRPSYVLSGQAMAVAFNETELEKYLKEATALSEDYPVVISKFILNAREIEIDAVADKGEIAVMAVTEHIENAGVHSGDATMALPPQKTYFETIRRMKEVARKLAKSLNISGPFNIQFIAKNNEVKVIECNLRASRSMPFVSKVTGTDFIGLATHSLLGIQLPETQHTFLELDHVGVKAPQFSFSRLKGADPVSGVEMASTGEVACIGTTFEDAFLKSLLSTGYNIPKKNILISLTGEPNRQKMLGEAKAAADAGYNLLATEHTHEFLLENGVKSTLIHKIHEKKKPNVLDYLHDGKIDLAIIVADPFRQIATDPKYDVRRAVVDFNVPLVTNLQIAKAFVSSFLKLKEKDLEILPWRYYI
ncbi:MAG: carbamoyl phosphate synthase large subunit [Candidatus Diapherotrites archaeon CG11_big_fil_rev_8_21_14_0_20_37_9]|nr:MAG: carbamoyl phosphate synthase large subunit [Candidatus Diapherotrites archaeon CG11_big_fil_rev_8_21_14_0_20_37_9]